MKLLNKEIKIKTKLTELSATTQFYLILSRSRPKKLKKPCYRTPHSSDPADFRSLQASAYGVELSASLLTLWYSHNFIPTGVGIQGRKLEFFHKCFVHWVFSGFSGFFALTYILSKIYVIYYFQDDDLFK